MWVFFGVVGLGVVDWKEGMCWGENCGECLGGYVGGYPVKYLGEHIHITNQ